MATSNFSSMENFPLWVVSDDDFEEEMDWITWAEDIQLDLDRANESFNYYMIELRSGYYSGCQFYVQEKPNEELYDKTVDEIKALTADEIAKVKAVMQEIGEAFGMFELKVAARFSNGETMYEKVDKE